MSLFIHTLFLVSFLWMVLHFWRQLPLAEGETDSGRIRVFVEWAAKGVGLPVVVWYVVNLGVSRWVPPFLSEVDHLRTEAAINGTSWLWPAIGVCSPAMSVIVSYWAALTLAEILRLIWARTEDRSGFKITALVWGGFMWPVSAVILWIGGWPAAGFALVAWLAPSVRATLPAMILTKRAPGYAQAIAKMKFGKYSEAEWEVIKELEQCENDFTGWMMLAELYAVHFHDFQQARQTIRDLCAQPDTNPSDVCVALHRLADWSLELERDPDAARHCMDIISQRYPGTHLAKMARLRSKRIEETAREWTRENRHQPLPPSVLHDVLDEPDQLHPIDPVAIRERAEWLSKELSRDPNDVSAREEFARALARLDDLRGAIEQVTLLLEMEGQPTTRRAEWMGLKATWLVKLTPESPDVLSLLRKIIRDFPHSAQAVAAQRRIFLLGEQARVAKYGRNRKRPRIVIRLGDRAERGEQKPAGNT